ncbi:MAG: hypothetical protein NOI47_000408 [Candidatus Phytoplasma pruni]|nr:hypothetical protein [Candidatus Phytoplasma pruni]
MKRYDINVLDRKDIPNVLKYFNLQCGGFYDPNIPSYNAYRQTTLYYYLKNPPSGLLGVYFKPRLNPFKIEYPYADNNYTLEDLLKYEIAIEEAFVFWDAKQKPQDENVNIKVIVSDIFADQNKEERINQYLINNNIIKQPKLIKLGCYNATTNTGLVAPLPSRTFHEIDIDAVYFDDGIRIIKEQPRTKTEEIKELKEEIDDLIEQCKITKNFDPSNPVKILVSKIERAKKVKADGITAKDFYNYGYSSVEELIGAGYTLLELYDAGYSAEKLVDAENAIKEQINTLKQELTQLPGNIEDLLKLSNGAKNIYLFTFIIEKRVITIDLPDSLNPYEAIRDWKRANNLSAYEGKWLKENGKVDFTENNSEIRLLVRSHGFPTSFTVNVVINIFETKDKIYRIVCKDGQPKTDLWTTYIKAHHAWLDQCYIKYGCTYQAETIRDKLGRSSRTLYDENGNTHYYRYEKGLMYDNWYIDGNDCASGGDRWQTRTYYQFLDNTPPPKKPDILDS